MAKEHPIRTTCPVCESTSLSLHGNDRFFCRDCGATCSRRPRACIICENPIPHGRKKNTCSDICHVIKRKNTDLEHYHRKTMEDPLYNHKKREKYKKNPDFEKIMHDQEARKWQRIKEDPDRYEKHKERLRNHYAEHAEKIQEKRRKALAALTPEQLVKRIEGVRQSSQKYDAKKRAILRQNPMRHQEYLDKLREYRRIRALNSLMELNAELERRLSKEKNNDGNNE